MKLYMPKINKTNLGDGKRVLFISNGNCLHEEYQTDF